MEYCITVTYKCNWNCEYCVIDTHNAKEIGLSNLEDINNIKNGQKVSISGGEPGLVSDELLIKIIKKLREKSCIIQINSNGTIFRKPHIVEMVDSIFYHCTKDFEINDVVNRDFPNKTTYMAVVSDNNHHNLDAFLKKNSDLNIHLLGAKGHLKKSLGIKLYLKYKDIIETKYIEKLIDARCGKGIVLI